MIKDIKKKLCSKRGASIILALLLFLVCAVVGSIVLTAATAAAGRMSQMVKMDQRYYSVTSAAELLRSQIDGKKIRITTEPTTTTPKITKREVIDENGMETTVNDDSDFWVKQTEVILHGEHNDIPADDITYPIRVENAISAKVDTSTESSLAVDVEINQDTDTGRGLVFTFSNHVNDTDTDKNKYQLKMTCTADILQEVVPQDGKDIMRYTVTWNVSDFSK